MNSENSIGKRSVGSEVTIDAPLERVWEALTEGKELERWFPLEARVEPGKGGSVWMSWKNEYAGRSLILEWEPNQHLRTSWGELDGSKSLQVTDYYLESRGTKTIVRAVTSGFPEDPDWDAWVEGTRRGWEYELQALKWYLERHRGKDREVVYLRRRVAMTAEQAWSRLDLQEIVSFGSAEPFIDAAPHQFAAVLPQLADSIMRVSVDPCVGGDIRRRDVTLWLASYGVSPERRKTIAQSWQEILEHRFPEGTDVQSVAAERATKRGRTQC